MKEHNKEFIIGKMAKTFGVSRSGYYHFHQRKLSCREKENQRIIQKIKMIYEDNYEIYGSPRIHEELKKEGVHCSRKRVAKLMQKEGIKAKMHKTWKRTTKQSKNAIIEPNLLQQNFSTNEPNRVWVSDISYITTEEGWLYLAIVLDLFSRKVVGLSTGKKLEATLVTKALSQALCHRKPEKGLIHHSDRGSQYTSEVFRKMAKEKGIILSMSAKGHCYDNAVAESFFHTLKNEHVNFFKYKTREEATNSIFEYTEIFYNRKRLHSTIGYLSPEEFEETWLQENVYVLAV